MRKITISSVGRAAGAAMVREKFSLGAKEKGAVGERSEVESSKSSTRKNEVGEFQLVHWNAFGGENVSKHEKYRKGSICDF